MMNTIYKHFTNFIYTLIYLKPIQIIYRPIFKFIRKFASINLPKYLINQSYKYKINISPKVRKLISIKLQSRNINCFFNLVPWQKKDENQLLPLHLLNKYQNKWQTTNYIFNSCYEEAKALTYLSNNKTTFNLTKIERYYLNYFNFLDQQNLSLEEKLYLIFDWISKNYNEHSEPWEPYVVSKRIQNIVKWITTSFFREFNPQTVNYKINSNYLSYLKTIENFLYFQVKRLVLDTEYHLQGNHLLENFISIVIGSVYLLFYSEYKNKTNISVYFKILNILQNSFIKLQNILSLQILPDGAHEERTPLYQIELIKALNILKNLIENLHSANQETNLELKNIINDLIAYEAKLSHTIEIMKDWLSNMLHPDNNIALFHDSYFIEDNTYEISNLGIIYKNQSTEKYLQHSKYFIKKWQDNTYFVSDLGEPSPAHQPGHSHCSAISYELSINGTRVITDCGVGSYDNDKVRLYSRSSYAHNIPILENTEQSEIWGAFRIARRSKVYFYNYIKNQSDDSSILLVHLKDYHNNLYLRIYKFYNSKIEIEDKIIFRSKSFEKNRLISLIHIAPGLDLYKINDNLLQIKQINSFPQANSGLLNNVFIEFKNRFEINNCHIFYYLAQPMLSKVIKIYTNTDNDNEIKYSIYWK